jgi:hypothetical protein
MALLHGMTHMQPLRRVHACDAMCLLCVFRAEEAAKKQAIRAAKAEAEKKFKAGFKVSTTSSSLHSGL